jgi:hypothetical protein
MDVGKRADAGTFGFDRERTLVPQVSDGSPHPNFYVQPLSEFLSSPLFISIKPDELPYEVTICRLFLHS